MANLATLLKTAKKNWGETVTNAKSAGYAKWDDGKYIALFLASEVKEASTGTWGISNQFEIVEGDREGDTYYNWINFFNKETNEISSFVVQFLETITGTDAEELDIAEVEAILEDAVNAKQYYSFILKTKGEYQNLKSLKQLEDYEPEGEEEPAKPAPKATPAKTATPPAKATATKATAKAKPEPEPEPEEEDETGEGVAEGDEVSFTVNVKGKPVELTGTISSVDDDEENAEVVVGEGKTAKTYTVSFDDLNVIESDETDEDATESTDEDEEVSFEVGEEVSFEVDGNELTGAITSIDEEAETLKVKVGKKTYTVEFSDVITEDEGASLDAGDTVEFEDPKTKKTLQGSVISVDDDAQEAKIKVGAKTFTVKFEDLVKIEEEEE